MDEKKLKKIDYEKHFFFGVCRWYCHANVCAMVNFLRCECLLVEREGKSEKEHQHIGIAVIENEQHINEAFNYP